MSASRWKRRGSWAGGRTVPPGFFSPVLDLDGMVELNAGTMTRTQASNGQWTVSHDGTASNTTALAWAVLWPLRDINGDVVPAGANWNIPRLLLRWATPPVEDSDFWAAVLIVGGATFGAEYSGGGNLFDAAPGPDTRRIDSAAGPQDSGPITGSAGLLVSHAAVPHHSTANAVRNFRVAYQPLDTSGDPQGAPPALNGSEAFILAPHFALVCGNSSGAGVAGGVIEAGYAPSAPTPSLDLR